VETKLRPPRPGPQRIPRVRLDQLLAQASERLLTVIRAPGGFGKTTLALSWVETLRARGDAVAWLSLEPDDDEPRRFLNYAIRALRQACSGIGSSSLASGNAPSSSIHALLVNEIADCGDDLFFFLDDYHAVSDAAIHEFVSFLLRHAPANLRVVILSRTEPAVGLASLRAKGSVLEIDATQLRFTPDETQEFFGVASGQQLTPAEVGAVHGVTEGWPAALRITSLSFRAGRDPALLARSLAGASRSIAGFFDELCALLPPRTLDFMLRTAVLERLSLPLCAAVTGRDDCGGMLAALERDQLVTPLDTDGSLYTCHQLFREYLLQRLARQEPRAVPELHRRAGHWHESREEWSESVKHLLAAGDIPEALVSISRCADTLVQSGDMLTLLGWEQQLRSKHIRRPPQLELAIAWARTLSLSGDDAVEAIAGIERTVETGAVPDGDAILRECLALRLVRAGLADDHLLALELARRYRPEPEDRAFARDAAYNAVRYSDAMAADWATFHAVPRVVQPVTGNRASVLTAIYEAYTIGIAELAQAHGAEAARHFLYCIELGRNVTGFAGATRLAAGGYAEFLYESERIDEADALLREETGFAEGGVSLDSVLRTLGTAARIAARHGRIEQAHGLLERAESIGLTRGWPRLVAAALFERLRLHVQAGRYTAALGLLRRLQQMQASAPAACKRGVADVPHYCTMAQALVDIGQNRHREAATGLAPLFAEARQSGSHLLAIRAGSILALAQLLARNPLPALRTLHEVLDLAEPSGFVGSIADAGPEIGALVGHVVGDLAPGTASERRVALIDRLQRAVAAADGGAARETASRARELRALLSPRECEILELIAGGQSNKSIARALGLGPETVKTHLKNVFAKLGVERRTQAVLRAEELGLVRARSLV